MSPEDLKVCEEMLTTFATPGWKYFLEDFAEQAKTIASITTVNDEQSLYKAKGKLDVINAVLNYEDALRVLMDDAEVA